MEDGGQSLEFCHICEIAVKYKTNKLYKHSIPFKLSEVAAKIFYRATCQNFHHLAPEDDHFPLVLGKDCSH